MQLQAADKTVQPVGLHAWCVHGLESLCLLVFVVVASDCRQLEENALTGTLPEGWPQTLPNLETLSLQHNQLRCDCMAPQWIAAHTLPATLDATFGNTCVPKQRCPPGTALCSGSLPPSWQQFGGLQLLWLHHNQLTGSLPLGLGVGSSLPRLTHLDVSYNQLTGRLPPGLGSGDGNACTVPPMPSALQYL